jgi:hypothetical protein
MRFPALQNTGEPRIVLGPRHRDRWELAEEDMDLPTVRVGTNHTNILTRRLRFKGRDPTESMLD